MLRRHKNQGKLSHDTGVGVGLRSEADVLQNTHKTIHYTDKTSIKCIAFINIALSLSTTNNKICMIGSQLNAIVYDCSLVVTS